MKIRIRELFNKVLFFNKPEENVVKLKITEEVKYLSIPVNTDAYIDSNVFEVPIPDNKIFIAAWASNTNGAGISYDNLTDIVPIIWIDWDRPFYVNGSDNGIASTNIVDASVFKTSLITVPVNRRVVAPRRYWYPHSILGATLDNLSSGTLPTLGNVSPWATRGVNAVKNEWEPWLDTLVDTLGGTFGYLVNDNEYMEPFYNFGLTQGYLFGITNDSRFNNSYLGLTSFSILTSSIDLPQVLNGVNGTDNQYIKWNNVTRLYSAKTLNSSLWDYSKTKLPNLKGSNYSWSIKTNSPSPNAYGHPELSSAIFGTASSPYLYGEVGQISTAWGISANDSSKLYFTVSADPTIPRLPKNTWSSFLRDQQEIRCCRRSAPNTAVQPWIAGLGYTGTSSVPSFYSQDSRYYYENIYHSVLLGAEIFLLFNDKSTTTTTNTTNELNINNTNLSTSLSSVNNVLNNRTVSSSISVNGLSFTSQLDGVTHPSRIVTTGAILSDNSKLWRTTVTGPNGSILINTNNGSQFILNDSVGVWDTTSTKPNYIFSNALSPLIATINPNIGVVEGGTTITIIGTNLSNTSSITIGGVAATSITNVSSTSVTCITPQGVSIGLKNISLTTSSGNITVTNAYNYIESNNVINSNFFNVEYGGGTEGQTLWNAWSNNIIAAYSGKKINQNAWNNSTELTRPYGVFEKLPAAPTTSSPWHNILYEQIYPLYEWGARSFFINFPFGGFRNNFQDNTECGTEGIISSYVRLKEKYQTATVNTKDWESPARWMGMKEAFNGLINGNLTPTSNGYTAINQPCNVILYLPCFMGWPVYREESSWYWDNLPGNSANKDQLFYDMIDDFVDDISYIQLNNSNNGQSRGNLYCSFDSMSVSARPSTISLYRGVTQNSGSYKFNNSAIYNNEIANGKYRSDALELSDWYLKTKLENLNIPVIPEARFNKTTNLVSIGSGSPYGSYVGIKGMTVSGNTFSSFLSNEYWMWSSAGISDLVSDSDVNLIVRYPSNGIEEINRHSLGLDPYGTTLSVNYLHTDNISYNRILNPTISSGITAWSGTNLSSSPYFYAYHLYALLDHFKLKNRLITGSADRDDVKLLTDNLIVVNSDTFTDYKKLFSFNNTSGYTAYYINTSYLGFRPTFDASTYVTNPYLYTGGFWTTDSLNFWDNNIRTSSFTDFENKITNISNQVYPKGTPNKQIQDTYPFDFYTRNILKTITNIYLIPTITSITPVSGALAGGTTITIIGTNLSNTSSITIGGVAATITNVSSTSVTCITPAGTIGARTIVLTTPGGIATSTFTYIGIPTITSTTPSFGILTGGTTITITGTNLSNTSSITIGGVAATSITNVSSTSVTAVTPARSVGAKTISLTTPGGTGTSTFTYVTQIPKIQNYASYNPTSTSSLSASVGCISKFNSPSYVFPSWDDDISVYTAGFTFGVVKIKDFFTLSSATIPDPNDSLSCAPINNLDFARIQNLADTRISDLWVLDTTRVNGYEDINVYDTRLINTRWALRDREQGGYTSAPNGRLQKWTLPLSYTDRSLANVIKGTTAISGLCASLTYNKFNILSSLLYAYGGRTGDTVNIVHLKNFKAGITGAQNLIKRPYSFNDIKTFGLSAGHTLFGNIGTGYAAVAISYNSTSAFALERNRLLGSLSQIDEWQSYSLLNSIWSLSPSWRFQREIRQNSIGFPNPSITLMTQPEIDAVNSDTLNNLKILLDEYKTHYPLARSNNGLAISNGGQNSPHAWRLNASAGYPMGLCGSFGIRTSPYPLGATLDFIPALGLTVDTWSPQGWTADTGMYLFDGWGMRYLLDNMIYIDGVTSVVEPVTTTSQLTADSSWNNILAEVRTLFLKEIFDYVIHTEEGRAWYAMRKYWPGGTERDSKIYPGYYDTPQTFPDPNGLWTEESGRTGGKDPQQHHFHGTGYWYPEPDNKGYVTTNQNVTPMAYRMLATMYLYPFMTTNQQRNTLLSAYNMMSEECASVLERAMMGITAPDNCGHWMEGWGYASQSMPDVIKMLVAARDIGDRRLWDGKTTPDYFNKSIPGISYSSWVNNSWKWVISRIMPNNLIINSGSCNSSGWETQGNNYQFAPWGIYNTAVNASEYPTPGTTGSAISELHDWFQNGGLYSEELEYAYKIKKYQERDTYNEKINPPWYYSPGDCILTWKSEHVIPRLHSDWTFGSNVDRPDGRPGYVVTNFNKPLVFGIWAKGIGVSDEKTNFDCGHISAYLGDAVLLLDNGEPRQIWEQNTKEFNFFFERECYRAKGHNVMQLGERFDVQSPKPAPWTGITFTATGGSAFMNAISNYNVRPLKPRSRLGSGGNAWAAGDNSGVGRWVGPSEGYLYTAEQPATRGGDTGQYLAMGTKILNDPLWEPYQYQIKTCTRGITWEYSAGVAKIKIQDIVGISAFNSNPSFWTATGPYATGPETRVYYRFHTGYTGANDIAGNPGLNSWPFFSTLDTGLTFFSVSGTNNKTWQAAWTQPIPYNTMAYDGVVSRLDSVGVTMTFVGSQPIRLTKELSINHSFKYPSLTVPGVGITAPSRHYAINILLGTSGGVFHDEKNLTLNTTIDAAVKKRDEFLIFYDDDVFAEDEIKFKSVGGKKMYELAGGPEIGWNSGDWVLKKSDVIKGVTFLATTFGLTASTTNEYIFLDFETVPGTDSMILSGFTGASNSAELFGQTSASKYMSEWILGRTLGGGITFDGLRHYFPGCKFGSYGPSWYPNDVAFTDGSAALNNKIDFLANNLVTNCRSFLDAYDVYSPSVYSVTGNKKMCRWINAQNVRLYNKINSLLGTTKAIIPWTSPFYWTNSTCNAYVNQTFANGFALEYTPPGTIMLDTDYIYEQAEPLILSGAKGAIVWSHYKYRGEQIIGRSGVQPEDNLEGYVLTDPPTTLSNRDTVGHTVKSCRQWPEHTSDPSRGGTASLWSFKANWRQAISAHENYIKGRDMGITGNRWWYKEISGSTVYTPLDWGNLDINPADGHITGITGSNLTKKTYSDAVYRSINTLKNTYNTKDIWASTTQGLTATW